LKWIVIDHFPRAAAGGILREFAPPRRRDGVARDKGVLFVIDDHRDVRLAPARPDRIAQGVAEMQRLGHQRFLRLAQAVRHLGMLGRAQVAQGGAGHRHDAEQK
jgi:hypothetical protein